MQRARDMLEHKVEEQDACDPSVDSHIRLDVGIVEHAFNVLRIYFDDQIVNAYDPKTCSMQASKEAIELKLWL